MRFSTKFDCYQYKAKLENTHSISIALHASLLVLDTFTEKYSEWLKNDFKMGFLNVSHDLSTPFSTKSTVSNYCQIFRQQGMFSIRLLEIIPKIESNRQKTVCSQLIDTNV